MPLQNKFISLFVNDLACLFDIMASSFYLYCLGAYLNFNLTLHITKNESRSRLSSVSPGNVIITSRSMQFLQKLVESWNNIVSVIFDLDRRNTVDTRLSQSATYIIIKLINLHSMLRRTTIDIGAFNCWQNVNLGEITINKLSIKI